MSQFGCSKGHQWIDMWEPGNGTPPGCPQCGQDSQQRSRELAELKNIIKEAILEALNEQKENVK